MTRKRPCGGTKDSGFRQVQKTSRMACRKCGGASWTRDAEPLTWGCVYCGNRAYLTHGTFRQQVDSIMASARRTEYVYSPDGKKIVPKLNETVKRIRFAREQDRRASVRKKGAAA